MYKLNIKPEYKFKDQPKGADGKEVEDRQITFNYLSIAINNKYPQGLPKEQRRTWARVQTKMEAAVDESVDFVLLETDEKDLIQETFKEAIFEANSSRLVTILEKEINALDENVVTLPETLEQA